MATTKIWPVRDNLKRIVDYAGNPEKTEYTDLRQELNYVGERRKTQSESERLFYITGVHCGAKTAYEDMLAVKKHFGKTDGNIAYHAYQSFKPGEVTPEQCHEIGVKLAKTLWGDRYQVLVATHLNCAHLHNHFLVNSVSFIDGKKFNDNKAAYLALRKASDMLCSEYGLSTIKNPLGRTPRSIYFAEKQGEPTKFNLMREALDSALRYSSSTGELATALRDMGYEFACEQTRKYPTIRRIGDKKAVWLRRLGEQYEVEAISRRLEENREWHGSGLLYRVREREARTYTPPLRRYVRGNLKRAKKPGGLRGLYLHYCFLLGILPKGSMRRPLSPEMREECRRLDELSHQAQLLCWEKLVTGDDVQRFVKTKQDELQTLTAVRSRCYNRLRRCDDPETVETVRRERSALTGQIAACRKDIRTAQVVLQRSAAMQRNVKIEQAMRAEQQARLRLLRTRERSYER